MIGKHKDVGYYESNDDCFKETEHIKSYLLYGDPSLVKEPLFTILIPTYCRPSLLNEAIKSVLKQWHVTFHWDILILDNDPYDGIPNKTEKMVRSINNPRILYYRNEENLHPCDNFNRGFLLSRGKWVMMLHDDDLLIYNSLKNMGKVIEFLEKEKGDKIGAISVKYRQIIYNPNEPKAYRKETDFLQSFYSSQPTNYHLIKLTHNHVYFTSHIGGDIPSNGATYKRSAVLDIGGFNKKYGICADLILYYSMENKYDVYSTVMPYGLFGKIFGWTWNTFIYANIFYQSIDIKSIYLLKIYKSNKKAIAEL